MRLLEISITKLVKQFQNSRNKILCCNKKKELRHEWQTKKRLQHAENF